MPLYSYKCGYCGQLIENFVHKDPPETVECPLCGSAARKQFPSRVSIRYGKAGVGHVSDSKGVISPLTGKFEKMDSFQYAKELDQANLQNISTEEWEKDQEIKGRRREEDIRRSFKQAKKKILSTPGSLSEGRLRKKREDNLKAQKA